MRAIWPFVFWFGWGLWIAISDLQNTDVQPTVIKLIVGAAVLGFARPSTWWIWSLALAAWVPLEPMVASLFHLVRAYHTTFVGALALPPIPALIGGLVGRTFARSR
jgi:hypothetical protein